MRNYAVINIGSSFKQALWILGSVTVNLVYWTCFNYFNYFVLSAVLVLVLGVQSEKSAPQKYSDNVASAASSVVTATKVLFILQIPNGE